MRAPLICVLSVLVVAIGACASTSDPDRPVLRVLTLNLHHGMGTEEQEEGSDPDRIRANLAVVGAMIRREAVDVAAFQEADGPSTTTGNFDHVATVASLGGLGQTLHGLHSNRKGREGSVLRYGTAIASRLPLTMKGGGTFPGAPLDHKGFVVAAVTWEGRDIDVVSVHLNFLLSPVRLDQIRLLVQDLSNRDRPLIILGDMNCTWTDAEKTLRELAESLGLEAHDPEDEEILTYPSGRPARRLDWIFVSSELEIRDQRVLPDRLSDHRAVLAEVLWRLP